MANKKFDYDLFRANDRLARDIGKAYWKKDLAKNPKNRHNKQA